MMLNALIWPRLRRSLLCMFWDEKGIAAIEFSFIAPVMLIAFFGTVEFCSGIAVDRKVTLTARTVSDLISQAAATNNVASVVDTDLQNAFSMGIPILNPYNTSPIKATVSEIYVDSTGKATIQWSKAATYTSGASQATLATSARNSGDNVTSIMPAQLLIKQTYLILSEISYQYVPTIGYVMAPAGLLLKDSSYTRPRQGLCIVYNNNPALSGGACPQT